MRSTCHDKATLFHRRSDGRFVKMKYNLKSTLKNESRLQLSQAQLYQLKEYRSLNPKERKSKHLKRWFFSSKTDASIFTLIAFEFYLDDQIKQIELSHPWDYSVLKFRFKFGSHIKLLSHTIIPITHISIREQDIAPAAYAVILHITS